MTKPEKDMKIGLCIYTNRDFCVALCCAMPRNQIKTDCNFVLHGIARHRETQKSGLA
jgi:hypothetical protein